MMKLAVVLLFTATTVFAFHHELRNYEGPCKEFGEYLESESEKCKSEIHAGNFTIPEEFSKEIKSDVDEITKALNKKFAGVNLTADEVVEHARVQFCVISKMNLIKDNKFDFEGFEKIIKEGPHFKDTKAVDGILAALQSLKQHEKDGKTWTQIFESHILDDVLNACEIKPEHFEPAATV